MGLRINGRQEKWVIWIFQQFIEGRSINWIARELTRRKVPRGKRAKSHEWYAPTIRRMLSNEKYIGRWSWGRTTTVRNLNGDKKPIPTKNDEVVVAALEDHTPRTVGTGSTAAGQSQAADRVQAGPAVAQAVGPPHDRLSHGCAHDAAG
jgi:hypothetical protein